MSGFTGQNVFDALKATSFLGVSGGVNFQASGDRGFGITFKMFNHIRGEAFAFVGAANDDGTVDGSVDGAVATAWEYARPDLVEVNTPLEAAEIFSTPQALGFCGELGVSNGGDLIAYCNAKGLCTDRGCLCDDGWGADFCTDEQTRPNKVVLGLLYPLVKDSDGEQVVDHGGKRRLLGALMAIDDINNKRPPYENLLPETEILFTVRDSKRSTAEASLQALDLLDAGVEAVIGAASSGPSGQQVAARPHLSFSPLALLTRAPITLRISCRVAKLFAIYKMAQISYSSTSAALTDTAVYPCFSRTPPTDSLQSKVMAQMISASGWMHAVTLSGDDAYSESGIADFRKSAVDAGIAIPLSRQFVRGTDSVEAQLMELKATNVKLIVMFAQADDMVTVFKVRGGLDGFFNPLPYPIVLVCHSRTQAAKTLKMWGSDGFTWVLSEIILGSYPDLIEGLGGQSEVDLAFRGAFTQVPSNGAGTAAYESLATRWAQTPNTATNGPSGGCSEDTDNFGYYLWQQDATSPGLRTEPVANASNLLCAGFDPSEPEVGTPSQYVPQVAKPLLKPCPC